MSWRSASNSDILETCAGILPIGSTHDFKYWKTWKSILPSISTNDCSIIGYISEIYWHIPILTMDILYQWEVHLHQSIATTLQPWGSQSLSRLGVGAHQVPTLGPATPSKQKWWRLRKAWQVYYPSNWLENPWCKQSVIGSTWFNLLFLQTTQLIQRYQASP